MSDSIIKLADSIDELNRMLQIGNGGLALIFLSAKLTAASGGYTNTHKLLRVIGFHNGATWCLEAASDMVFS